MNGRAAVKRALALVPDGRVASGATILIYHRIGGGSCDEMDIERHEFARHLDVVAEHDVVALDTALDRLAAGDDRPTVVLTFDDGFDDVYRNGWPLLRERQLPFVVYLAGGLIGGSMRWEGSTAAGQSSAALSWDQLAEMKESGLCTVGNHTFSHARPELIDEAELDRCSAVVEARLGHRPDHFAWPWGIEVPALRAHVERRFRSAVTGTLGRNHPGDDPLALKRIPVRGTDPMTFFRAKFRRKLRAERIYRRLVTVGKKATAGAVGRTRRPEG